MRKWLSFFAVVLLVLPICLPTNAKDLNILVAQEEAEEPWEDQDEGQFGVFIKEITIEGILSIQSGDNPRVVEQKLKAFISPALRSQVSTGK